MIPIRGAFLLTLELAEQLFSVPVEEREALLQKMAKEHKAKFIGITDKSAPELATECIKAGIRAQSFVKGKGSKKPLTNTPKSGKLVIEKDETLLQKRKPPM